MKYNLLAILLCCILSSNAQYPIVTIDNSTVNPNEPTIYINPNNVGNIVAGSNIDNLYVSIDTGKTWKLKVLTSSLGVYGDPVVYCDDVGNFFYCHLSATKSKRYPHWIDRIVVQKSMDGGETFSDGSFAGYNGNKEQDKHWIIKDQNSTVFRGNIYLSWTEFDKYESKDPNDHSRIRFARSVNDGASFEDAITISDTVGDCMDDDLTLEGATPAIGAKGEVYVAWAGYGKLYFDKSKDGGVTWGKDKVIAMQDDGWALSFNQIFRCNGLPFLVADHSPGNFKNRLYLVWGESHPNIGGEIKLKYSDNGGDTWSDEITVNSSSAGDQFLPHVAVDQNDGTVYIVFYDRRNSPSNILTDVYVAYSLDGGNTFTNKKVTRSPFLPAGKDVFFGDYNGISAHKGIVRPIWTATHEESKGHLVIQTALLTKESLKHKDQEQGSDIFYKYYQNELNNEFILYSGIPLDYTIKLKVKKSKYAWFGKTYRTSGTIYPLNPNPEVYFNTIKGKRMVLKMKLKGSDFNEKVKEIIQ